jgi:hypothetical protein
MVFLDLFSRVPQRTCDTLTIFVYILTHKRFLLNFYLEGSIDLFHMRKYMPSMKKIDGFT